MNFDLLLLYHYYIVIIGANGSQTFLKRFNKKQTGRYTNFLFNMWTLLFYCDRLFLFTFSWLPCCHSYTHCIVIVVTLSISRRDVSVCYTTTAKLDWKDYKLKKHVSFYQKHYIVICKLFFFIISFKYSAKGTGKNNANYKRCIFTNSFKKRNKCRLSLFHKLAC